MLEKEYQLNDYSKCRNILVFSMTLILDGPAKNIKVRSVARTLPRTSKNMPVELTDLGIHSL